MHLNLFFWERIRRFHQTLKDIHGSKRVKKLFCSRNDKLALAMMFRQVVRFQELVTNFPTILIARCLDMKTVATTSMRLTAEAWVQLRGGLCGMYSYCGQSLKGVGSSPSNPVLPLVQFLPLFLFIPLPPGEQPMDPLRVTVPHIHIHGLMSLTSARGGLG